MAAGERIGAIAMSEPGAGSDLAMIARGCGLTAWRATTLEEYREALAQASALPGPSLIDVAVDPEPYRDIYAALRE